MNFPSFWTRSSERSETNRTSARSLAHIRSLSLSKRRRQPSLVARAGLAGLATAVLVGSLIGAGGAAIQADPAAATSVEEEATASSVTLTSKEDALEPDGAPFPELELTISQTKDLVSQGIRISWTGGKQSARPDSNQGGANFLQIAQCWGEDPDNPGQPDRRTCQYGGGRAPGSDRDGSVDMDDIAPEDERYSADQGGYGFRGIPFVASNSGGFVDEDKAPADRVLNNFSGPGVLKPEEEWVDLSKNQFYSGLTTNEVRWAGAGADGSGSVPFEIQTAMQSTALGCGAPIVQPDDTAAGQSCWLVIIPRGTGDSGVRNITRSGLFWDAWEHHIAVKLEFKPLGVRCQIGEAERQLAGSELVAGAIASWQPGLCKGEDGSPFVLSQGKESDAAVRAAGTDPSPLAFTSRPVDVSRIAAPADPLVYAPVAIAGSAISFAIDREPHPFTENLDYAVRAGLPFTEMKLTPRLVAKLLTASYLDALPNGANHDHLGRDTDGDDVIDKWNPRTIVWDPDFRGVNDPEWTEQVIIGASIADALMPSGRSDIAVRLWEYVLSDPEARAWLDGADDGHGMLVNPWYSTNSELNPTGAGLPLPVDNFPKADPAEKPDETQTKPVDGSGAINLVTWRPYTESLAGSARDVLRGDGLMLGEWDKFAVPPKFAKAPRSLFGSQKVIGITSTPAAQLYQTVTASLRNSAGQFVAPTIDSLAAAAAAMTPDPQQAGILRYDFTGATARSATTSYPLTMPIYAALNPRQTDAQLRGAYANLIRYAVVEGQAPGTDIGELPPGYAPLPQSWVDQALAVADVMERGASIPVTPPVSTTTPPGEAASPGGTGAASTPGATSQGVGAPIAVQPVVTGQAAGLLAGSATPADPDTAPLAVAVPWGIAAGLASALAVLVIPRLRRRA